MQWFYGVSTGASLAGFGVLAVQHCQDLSGRNGILSPPWLSSPAAWLLRMPSRALPRRRSVSATSSIAGVGFKRLL